MVGSDEGSLAKVLKVLIALTFLQTKQQQIKVNNYELKLATPPIW